MTCLNLSVRLGFSTPSESLIPSAVNSGSEGSSRLAFVRSCVRGVLPAAVGTRCTKTLPFFDTLACSSSSSVRTNQFANGIATSSLSTFGASVSSTLRMCACRSSYDVICRTRTAPRSTVRTSTFRHGGWCLRCRPDATARTMDAGFVNAVRTSLRSGWLVGMARKA